MAKTYLATVRVLVTDINIKGGILCSDTIRYKLECDSKPIPCVTATCEVEEIKVVRPKKPKKRARR